jgi:phosphoglycolate phosphatase
MATYAKRERLVMFDADGTTVDAFHAVERTFSSHGLDIGDLERFQKRRRLFKYLGGLREFPNNLRRQIGKPNRKRLLATLTEVYRHEARLYPGIAALLRALLDAPGVRVGLLTRNVTIDPEATLGCLFARHGIDAAEFDYFSCISFGADKAVSLRQARERYAINPACAYACGDEYGDYAATIAAGMHPFVVAYGSEDRTRLIEKFSVPREVVSTSPAEFAERLLHALDLEVALTPHPPG